MGLVPSENLRIGHFLAVIGLPLYYAGYLHLYMMLRPGNEALARSVLAIGFIAFAVGGIWIGSRSTLGAVTGLKNQMDPEVYQSLITHYDSHLEALVKALRIIVATLSVAFATAILRGKTQYRKWVAIVNPITVLILLNTIGNMVPALGKHLIPILMNVAHFILFSISLIQLKINEHENSKTHS